MKMNKYFDHTLLAANATRSEVEQLCKEAREYDFMSVCVNPYLYSYRLSIRANEHKSQGF